MISVQQRLAVPANENVPQNSCDHRKRDKLQEKFHGVTEALSSLVGSLRSVFGHIEIVWRNSAYSLYNTGTCYPRYDIFKVFRFRISITELSLHVNKQTKSENKFPTI